MLDNATNEPQGENPWIESRKNACCYFEIPVLDFQRAYRFYCTIFGQELLTVEKESPARKFAVLPSEIGGVGGALLEREGFEPATTGNGPLIYLNINQNLDEVLPKAIEAGGHVVIPKEVVEGAGHLAVIRDTEGNEVGLHHYDIG